MNKNLEVQSTSFGCPVNIPDMAQALEWGKMSESSSSSSVIESSDDESDEEIDGADSGPLIPIKSQHLKNVVNGVVLGAIDNLKWASVVAGVCDNPAEARNSMILRC